MGQQVNQRDQQDKLAQHRHENRAGRVADGNEGDLAGDLNAEQEQRAAVHPQGFRREGDQFRVRAEQAGKSLRKEHNERPKPAGIAQAGRQHPTEGLPHPAHVARAEIIAGDRLGTLRDALQGQQGELHHAAQDGHSPHGQVAAVFQQGRIEADGDHTLAGLHGKGGQSQRDAGQNQLCSREKIFLFQPEDGLFPREKTNHPHAGNALRQDGGHCRAPDAHSQPKNQHRVQHDIQHSADEHRLHSHGGEALRRNKGVHTQRQLDEQGAEGVDAHIIHRETDGIFAGSEHKQHFPAPQQHHRRQNDGNDGLQHKAAAQNFFRFRVVSPAHGNGRAGRAAGGHEGRKGGDDQDQRHTHTHAGQGETAVHRHMADIDPIHDIIQHIDQLGDHRRHAQPPQQFSNGFGSQKSFILLHYGCSFKRFIQNGFIIKSFCGSCKGKTKGCVCGGKGGIFLKKGGDSLCGWKMLTERKIFPGI